MQSENSNLAKIASDLKDLEEIAHAMKNIVDESQEPINTLEENVKKTDDQIEEVLIKQESIKSPYKTKILTIASGSVTGLLLGCIGFVLGPVGGITGIIVGSTLGGTAGILANDFLY
jgi:t-SNARE complex subunit (syntaxin)